jgi:hypothetical protein
MAPPSFREPATVAATAALTALTLGAGGGGGGGALTMAVAAPPTELSPPPQAPPSQPPLPAPGRPRAGSRPAVGGGDVSPATVVGADGGADAGTPKLGRACASPFDWSDTLVQRSGWVAAIGSGTPPYELMMSPPASPRAHRAWSTSAVPDRPSPSYTANVAAAAAAAAVAAAVAANAAAASTVSLGNSGGATPLSSGSGGGFGYAHLGAYYHGEPPVGAAPAGGAAADDRGGASLRVDLERVLSGEETRTTVMVRNIPNKYTAAQLRAALDAVCPGGYDYLYLPMDFASHCNVGYAFVNFCSRDGLALYHRHQDGRRWELHHSDKVCELRFARIQGRDALILEHQRQAAKHGHRKPRPGTRSPQVPTAF